MKKKYSVSQKSVIIDSKIYEAESKADALRQFENDLCITDKMVKMYAVVVRVQKQ